MRKMQLLPLPLPQPLPKKTKYSIIKKKQMIMETIDCYIKLVPMKIPLVAQK